MGVAYTPGGVSCKRYVTALHTFFVTSEALILCNSGFARSVSIIFCLLIHSVFPRAGCPAKCKSVDSRSPRFLPQNNTKKYTMHFSLVAITIGVIIHFIFPRDGLHACCYSFATRFVPQNNAVDNGLWLLPITIGYVYQL